MNFEEFQHLARLSVVGALDPGEQEQFQAGRVEFGAAAEAFLVECHKLNAAFALSLRPCEPDPRTKARLLRQIQGRQGFRKGAARWPKRGALGRVASECH